MSQGSKDVAAIDSLLPYEESSSPHFYPEIKGKGYIYSFGVKTSSTPLDSTFCLFSTTEFSQKGGEGSILVV